ncbi:MAG: tetratricopeptide repeat protein, partial [Chitinophagales bacterium]
FGLAILIALGMYLFLPTKKNKRDLVSSGPASKTSLEEFRYNFINKQADSTKLYLNAIEARLSEATDSLTAVKALTEGIEVYNRLQAPEIAALFVFKKASYIQNTNSWELAGSNFISLLSDPKLDTNLYSDISKHAIQSFQKSIDLDSNNLGAKMKLAQCYMELSNQPMDGVQLLLGIVKKDSANIDAQLLLAKFGLVSGQLEKVSQRLENVLYLQPQNPDALLMRAEVFARMEKYELAAKDLTSVKNNSKTPQAMKEQLEVAIQDLKTRTKPNQTK